MKNFPAFIAIQALLVIAPIGQSTVPSVNEALNREAEWFQGEEGRTFVQNVLAHQSEAGSWAKNKNSGLPVPEGQGRIATGTFDNGATTAELRLLNRAFQATGEERVRAGILKGIDHILEAQYPTGGWPQSYPPGPGYHRHITFNDGAMSRLMELLRDVAQRPEFAWIDRGRRAKAQAAFDRGVDCILNAQVKVADSLTVWCAQHDEATLEPRPARTYELVSLSGSESAGLLRLLMSVEQPDDRLRRAIESGVKWFQAAKLTGLRQEKVNGDKRLVADADAPPLWARFYEIGTNRPIFSGRDGVKKYDMSEIEAERRNGYSWLGEWGASVLKEYQQWQKKQRSE